MAPQPIATHATLGLVVMRQTAPRRVLWREQIRSTPTRVTGSGTSLELGFVTQGPYSRNVGSRTYLVEDDENYKMLKLTNKEFTFTVDDSQLGCGLNGAWYFVQMQKDGGKSEFNAAGAKYRPGYCDAQCPRDLKFINGKANVRIGNHPRLIPVLGKWAKAAELRKRVAAEVTKDQPHKPRFVAGATQSILI